MFLAYEVDLLKIFIYLSICLFVCLSVCCVSTWVSTYTARVWRSEGNFRSLFSPAMWVPDTELEFQALWPAPSPMTHAIGPWVYFKVHSFPEFPQMYVKSDMWQGLHTEVFG